MSPITEKENELFEDWRESWPPELRGSFVNDGMVDPDEYARAPVKLLFVLKEVNDEDGGGWDLREVLRRGGQPQTWNTVARWVEGIEALPKVLSWDEHFEGQPDLRRRQQALRKIIAVNLKKEPGGDEATPHKVREAAQRDRRFILDQLSLYAGGCAPDYVICCGDLVTEALFGEVYRPARPLSDVDWTQTTRGVGYARENGTPHFGYYHPGYYAVWPPFLHYGLIDAVAEARMNAGNAQDEG